MPVDWRLHVLEERLKEEGFDARINETADMHELDPDEITAVLDAMVESQKGFPVVLVNGRVACTGDIDVERVVQTARGTC